MENEIVWIADFGIEGTKDWAASPPKIGTAVVVKRTAKKVIVKSCEASGYREHLEADRCFSTREELVVHIRERCIRLAEMHESIAARFRAAVEGEIK